MQIRYLKIFLFVSILYTTNSQAQSFLKNFKSVSSFAKLGNNLFFAGEDEANGIELWKSDGTPEGTVLVKNIGEGTKSGEVANLYTFNGKIYFAANDGINGNELWVSDGTSNGTVLLKNINNNISLGAYPQQFIECNGILYFTASPNGNNSCLWKTDGTASGTIQLTFNNTSNIGPTQLTAVGNKIYFANNINNILYKSDGTLAGTSQIIIDNYQSFGNLKNINDKLVFTTNTNQKQIRLYILNPADDSFTLLKSWNGDIDALDNVTQTGSVFYFSTRFRVDPSSSTDNLFKSDGTALGTQLVKSYPWRASTANYNMSNFTYFNNTLYFASTTDYNSPTVDSKLFKTNGTDAGTIKVSDLKIEQTVRPFIVNNKLFFISGGLLYSYDGTATKQELIQPTSIQQLLNINDIIYFASKPSNTLNTLWNTSPEGLIQVTNGSTALPTEGTINFTSKTDSLVTSVITVKNSGNKDLILSDISVTGASFYVSGQPSKILTAGKQTTFNISYYPSKNEQTTGKLNIQTNATNTGNFIATLNGTASGNTTTVVKIPDNLGKTISFTDSISAFAINTNFVKENLAINTAIGTFAINSPTDNYQYSFTSGTGDKDNNSFIINNGQLLSNKIFDFETKNVYTIRVKATGANNTFEKAFAINITDEQETLANDPCNTLFQNINYTLDGVAYTQSRIIAVGQYGNIILSDDDGQTWRSINLGNTNHLTAIKMTDNNTGYIMSTTGVVFKTENGGNSWFPLKSPQISGSKIYFYSSLLGIVYGSGNNTYRTNDGGKNWTQVNVPSGVDYYSAWFISENTGFISGSSKTLLRTTDGGLTWTKVTVGPLGDSTPLTLITFSSPSTGYMTSNNGDVLQTKDGGNTWLRINTGSYGKIYFVNETTGYRVNSSEIYKTTNGGITWIQETTNTTANVNFTALAYSATTNKYCLVGHGSYVGSVDKGRVIFLKDGSNQWVSRSTGSDGNYYHQHYLDDKVGYVFGAYNIKTIDGGITWKKLNLAVDSYNKSEAGVFLDQNIGFASDNSNLFKTTDGGENWLKIHQGVITGVKNIYFTNNQTGFLSSTDGWVYKTTDQGNTWTKVLLSGSSSIRKFQFSDLNNGYAISIGDKLFKTSDGGSTWSSITLPTGTYLTSYFFDSQKGFVAGTSGRLLLTNDGGAAWTPIISRIPSSATFNSFAFYDAQHGYAATDVGVYETFDSGSTWSFSSSAVLRELSIVNGQAYGVGDNGTIIKIGGSATPANAGYIYGDTTIATNIKATFSTVASEKNNYKWIAAGASKTEYRNNSIDVTWAQPGQYTLQVTPYNSCGDGNSRSITINVVDMHEPIITGPNTVLNLDSGVNYQTINRNGNSYLWQVTGGSNTPNINQTSVNWGNPGKGVVTVVETNPTLNLKKLATLNVTINTGTAPIIVSPTTQAFALTITNITPTSAKASWTNGNGTSRAVFITAGFTTSLPSTGVTYNANTSFRAGTQIGTSGYYCVYNGTGSSVDITGLNQNGNYRVIVIEYNGKTGNEQYLNTIGIQNQKTFTTPNTSTILSSLLLSSGATLSPTFSPTIYNYTVNVNASVSSLTVTPSTNLTNSVVRVNNSIVTSGSVSGSITLNTGENIITVTLTPQGGVPSFYTIKVIKDKSNQNIIFSTLPTKQVGDIDFSPGATSDNNTIPISYSSDNLSVATIVDNKIHVITYGTANITASQPENATFYAAPSVTQILTVVQAAPTIASFTPTTAATGATVTITGTNFDNDSAVSFGGTTAASFTVVSPTSITAVLAGGASGNVSVTTPGGTITKAGFVFVPAPTIASFTPTTAATGTTLTITGTNFDNASAVSFGGTTAASFTVVSPTSITAVVAGGASGNVSVTTPGGTVTKAGFVFVPAPTIASFTPTTAATGTTLTITGTNFDNASAVSFGGTAAASFTVVSPTSITAVVAGGASGNVTVTTPGGGDTKTGFTFVPSPTITASGSTTFASGSDVVLTAGTGTGYTYQWAKDGVDITGATNSTYTATTTGAYATRIVLNGTNTPSNSIQVNVVYVLPVNNFNLVINSVTCKGSNNGMVSINATQALNYTATITGNNTTNSYTFTSSKNITDLAPGTYNVCITVQGQPDYQQCYAVVITEPKDLALFSSVDKNSNTVTLQFDGGSGSIYNIALNGKTYSTTNSNITLPLNNGTNKVTVTTDKPCQGAIEKTINVSDKIFPYPDPFDDILNISLGNNVSNKALVSIHSAISGKLVFSKQYTKPSVTLPLELAELRTGVYILTLSLDNSQSVFKILKK